MLSALGYAAAYNDPIIRSYPLGNGYRQYLPSLMRFNAQDALSPFDVGGLNTYVYCAGDPVNKSDPTGHVSLTDLSLGAESWAKIGRSFQDMDDPVENQIHHWVESEEVEPIVLSGFSGMGYADSGLLEKKIVKIFEMHRRPGLVAGATKSGIGLSYEIAKRYDIPTLGIVSKEAEKYPDDISPFCDHVIYVPTPKDVWEVKSPQGNSYMLSPLKWRQGAMYAIGGGKVTVSEVTEGITRGYIPVRSWRDYIFPDFDPNPSMVAKEMAKRSLQEQRDFDPTPLRTFAQEEMFRLGRELSASTSYRYI